MSTRSCVTVFVLLLSRFEFTSGEWPQPVREGNPHFNRRLQLVSETGYYLTILPNGHVKGADEDSDPYTILDVLAAGVGKVKLRGVETGLYLAMDDRGILYGSDDHQDGSTVFIERPFAQYNTYESKEHRGWFVAIRKNGTAKPGPHTKLSQKSTKFLPVRGD
ncbi:fibroblast growth factor 1 isoform X2 [Anabrus simplex]|uniref:fibroblast growth factor 1 isoform X2 n=1 Tax=Anabrus simplex TaxID=316456 RepID=UPI0034DD68FE